MVKKIKIFAFVTILSLFLLSILNGAFAVAVSMQGQGTTFKVDKDDPLEYGVIIPDTNMHTAVSIDGFHQGKFVQMEYNSNPIATEAITVSGNDISFIYPWYFDGVGSKIYTPTDNDYIDPWDVRWLNISAYDAENETLSPYNLNTVWNYYAMSEGGALDIFLNSSIPMIIDININSIGPKILKYDWLTDNPIGPTIDKIDLISPSGKLVDFDQRTASHTQVTTSIFNYLIFAAQETGIYRLLLDAHYGWPTILRLEFLYSNIEALNTGVIKYGGVSDDIPTYQDEFDMEWSSHCYSFRGEKGDKFRLDIGQDYLDGSVNIDIWYPTASGYKLKTGLWGSNLIYTGVAGDIYVSFSEQNYYDLYRYSLYLTKLPVVQWNLNNTLETIKLSKDELKGVEFTIDENSFVRINSTSYPDGYPLWFGLDFLGGLIFKDAKKITGYEEITYIETKTVDGMAFYYYYLPKGEYEFIVANTFPEYDGVLQLSLEFIEYNNATIPINPLTYPNHNPSTFTTIDFTPDEYYTSLKEAQWFEINITESGQYRLNTSIWTSDNLGVLPAAANPSAVVVYNTSAGTYHDWTTECLDPSLSFPAFSDDGTTDEDYLYIAYPEKWGDIHYNFSQVGDGGEVYLYTWDGDWNNIITHTDNTRTGGDDFAQNGSQDISVIDNDFTRWIKGCNFDIPDIDEDLYYWMRVRCWDNFNLQLPYIELLKLSNITINGDVNFYLVRDSGYEYCDFWKPAIADQPATVDAEGDDFVININPANNFASDETWILDGNMNHHMNGIEPGVYKLLIIPAYWSHHGTVKLQFAIENYMPYAIKSSYNITANPTYHPWEIIDDILDPEKPWQKTNYSLYSYGETIQFNNTLVDINLFGIDGSKLFVECYGNALNWTQLVVCINNVTSYDLYLMQNLTWIENSGPNNEIMPIATNVVDNSTFEFGVLTDDFTLIFVFDEIFPQQTVTFKLGLSQYNTARLYAEAPIAEIGIGIDPVMVGWIIIIVAIIGGAAVVIVVIIKKRG